MISTELVHRELRRFPVAISTIQIGAARHPCRWVRCDIKNGSHTLIVVVIVVSQQSTGIVVMPPPTLTKDPLHLFAFSPFGLGCLLCKNGTTIQFDERSIQIHVKKHGVNSRKATIRSLVQNFKTQHESAIHAGTIKP